jgi:hypothetical protein
LTNNLRPARVRVHTAPPKRDYVLIDDIPDPWRTAFLAAIEGLDRPILTDGRAAAYACDWQDWASGRRWVMHRLRVSPTLNIDAPST